MSKKVKVLVRSNVKEDREVERVMKHQIGDEVKYSPREGTKRRGELDALNLLDGLTFTVRGFHVEEHEHTSYLSSKKGKKVKSVIEYYELEPKEKLNPETVRALKSQSYLNFNNHYMGCPDFEIVA